MDIRNCHIKFQCPNDWSALIATDNANIRHCDQCQRKVHFCDSKEALMQAMQQDWCVAISLNGTTAYPSNADPLELTPPTEPRDDNLIVGDIEWSGDYETPPNDPNPIRQSRPK
tara:strand:- start:1286 stop:1627 length:342 start_codon:yes stop_codon:yes gene_type:complete